MKMKNFLIFCLLLVSTFVYSQDWLQNLPSNKSKSEYTFYDFQKAFYSYWEPYNVTDGFYIKNGEKIKVPGWKQFKRWEYFWEKRIDPKNGNFPKVSSIDIYNEWWSNNRQNRSINGNWTSVGPSSSTGGYAGLGRLNCIAFHPTDNNTYWVGSPSGGLWKTTNDGSSWIVLTDSNDVLGVSDIAVSSNYSIDQTLYIATGDKDGGSLWSLSGGQSNDNNSIGVLKSNNGGTNWLPTGLTFAVNEKKTISKLLIDPNNNNILYAATSVGIYKTTDAGNSWTKVYSSTSSEENIIDLEFNTSDSQIIYASTKNYSYAPIVLISTNGGNTWSTIKTFATTDYRVDIAVTPANANYIYAIVANQSSALSQIARYNSGTWTTVYTGGTNLALLGYYSNASGTNEGQGSYDLAIAVSPTNDNLVLIGGVNSHKSTNGGTTWTCSNCWTSSTFYNFGSHPEVHADKHLLKYRSNGDLFECNDGGLYKSTNNGTSWVDKSNGIIHSQIYRIGVSQTNSNVTIAGLQDNGTKLLNSSSTWQDVKGGDGMECIIDYTNYNVQYGTYVNGQISRTTNAWSSSTAIQPAGYPGAWVTPYSIDPNNNQTLYAGYADVWKTTDRGTNWTKISTFNTSQKLRALAIAPSNSNYIYVTDPNQLWVTTDGGTSWTERTSGLPVSSNSITYVAVKADDPNTVWVTFGGYDGNRIYQSVNAGVTWTNISTGLPNIPVMSVVQNKQNTLNTELYVGTDVGVYLKLDSNNWYSFNSGLPKVVVSELEIYYNTSTPANSKLRAGTFGRGLWESNLYQTPTGSMLYVSSTTAQGNLTNISKGAIEQEIMSIQVETSGTDNPLVVSQFNLGTIGSTNPTTDISNAKLYFTGNSNIFATSSQFGSTYNNPNGSFTINGNQTLLPGINYFWLAYDIKTSATFDNVVDATCNTITINNSAKIPTTTAPLGNRKILPCQFCNPTSTTDDETGITKVVFNTINNTSLGDPEYTDYTNISTEIVKLNSYTLAVNVNTASNYTVRAKAWIDWNQDCDFDDSGEEYDLGSKSNSTDGTTSITPAISVPATAISGITRMRVRAAYSAVSGNCGNISWSEAEDYTLNIVLCDVNNTTTWHGSVWSNGTPNLTKPAVINGAFPGSSTFPSTLEMCSCTINNGFTLSIPAGKTLSIKNTITNHGTIIVEDDGSLLQENDDVVNSNHGTIEIQKTSTPYVLYDYTYWSAPITNETLSNVLSASPQNSIYKFITSNYLDLYGNIGGGNTDPFIQDEGTPDTYDDNNNVWVAYSGNMDSGVGYIAQGATNQAGQSTGQSVVFTATSSNNKSLHNGIIEVNVEKDAYNGADASILTYNKNENLIGNPYPSAINLNSVYSDNSNILTGTFYFWTHNCPIGATAGGPYAQNFTNDDYATLNVLGIPMGSAASSYTIPACGTSGAVIPTQYAASCQGFFAEIKETYDSVSHGKLQFKNAHRVSGNNSVFFKTTSGLDRFWISLITSTNEKIQTAIGFENEASDDLDDFDAKRMENGYGFDIYSYAFDNPLQKLAIQRLSTFNSEKVIPLGIEIVENGTYHISLDHVEGVFAEGQKIYLRDNYNGTIHDLSADDYRFTQNMVDQLNDRFELIFSYPLATDSVSSDVFKLFPNPSKGLFYIGGLLPNNFEVTVTDLTGKILKHFDYQTDTPRLIDMTHVANGIYLAKFSVNHSNTTIKLIVE